MSKLNLANLAQHEVAKDEAQQAKGGVICFCICDCGCTGEIRFEYQFDEKLLERAWVLQNP